MVFFIHDNQTWVTDGSCAIKVRAVLPATAEVPPPNNFAEVLAAAWKGTPCSITEDFGTRRPHVWLGDAAVNRGYVFSIGVIHGPVQWLASGPEGLIAAVVDSGVVALMMPQILGG